MPNPDRERTEQKEFFKAPSHIQFHKDSERILKRSLLAVEPEEGCAILIGNSIQLKNEFKHNIFRIQLIWPCCNVWEDKKNDHEKHVLSSETLPKELRSRKNRFSLDPKEQLSAQKWARTKGLEVLGIAHSHPGNNPPIPSKTDISRSFWTNLMVIVNSANDMKAWWVQYGDVFNPLELPFTTDKSSNIMKSGSQ